MKFSTSRLELLQRPARQASALQDTEHRPWPIPSAPWLLAETLEEQLFVHYPVPVEALRTLVPEGVEVDVHSGSAWLGLTAFALSGLRIRGLLPFPRLSRFLQLNVRTYVSRDAKPGIWFCSLDVSSRLAVEVGRRLYGAPLFQAAISSRQRGTRRVFESARADGKAFGAAYEPGGKAFQAEPGSLEHFLCERYCMYTERGGRLFRGEIHHRPWRLQPAEADIELNAMIPDGVHVAAEPLLHYSDREDVLLWPLEGVA